MRSELLLGFRSVIFSFLVAGAAWPLPSHGWWDGGHKLIALIAWDQLNEGQRSELLTTLTSHERFEEDFEKAMPPDIAQGNASDRAQWIIAQASIWPDLARKFPAGERDRFHRSTWHYVNTPLWLEPHRPALRPKPGQQVPVPELRSVEEIFAPASPHEDLHVSEMIPLLRNGWEREGVRGAERALLVCWLCHLVGDVHQPLHTVALFSPKLFPTGDRGGNETRVRVKGSINSSNLHMLWDGLLGGYEDLNEVRARKARLLQNPDVVASGPAAVATSGISSWLDEGTALAMDAVYTPEILKVARSAEEAGEGKVVVIQEAYLRRAGLIAQRRAVEGGYRLAEILRAGLTVAPSDLSNRRDP
ncbi:MAG: S1/P1 nuclease [Verrucomicrobiota bacterium]